jgi:Leucine-rich repeat (LRR) protein
MFLKTWEIVIIYSSIILYLFFGFFTQKTFSNEASINCEINNYNLDILECKGLQSLWEKSNGKNWKYNLLQKYKWGVEEDISKWQGLTIEKINNKNTVTEVNLYNLGLTGIITPEIKNLKNLKKLDLSYNNKIESEIPKEIGELQSLEILDLAGINLTGEIPKEIGNLSNLKELDLSSNNLGKTIPKEISNLQNLEILEIDNNKLIGKVPNELNNLESLEKLNLEKNEITEINFEDAKLKNLEIFDISSNELTIFPKGIDNLENLNKLDISWNNLKGNIPEEIKNLQNLKTLELDNNTLSIIPNEIGNLNNLETLDLNYNEITTIPNEIGNLKNLKSLDFYHNKIDSIPKGLSNLENLENLNVSHNEIYILPSEIGTLKNLKILELNNNKLKNIPKEIGNLKNLEILDLSYNDINSEISNNFSNLINLKELYINNNELEISISEIIKNISNLNKLSILKLGYNDLNGEIPSEISNLDSLEYLSLTNNEVSGDISLILSYLKNLKQLEYLVLSYNNFTGEIPNNIEIGVNTTQNVFGKEYTQYNLESLNLSNNNLTGKIPNNFSNLDNLKFLTLNDNNLTGGIPENIDNLKSLEYLILHKNNLSGIIPDNIKNLDNLEYLHLNNNQFTGEINEHIGELKSLKSVKLQENLFLCNDNNNLIFNEDKFKNINSLEHSPQKSDCIKSLDEIEENKKDEKSNSTEYEKNGNIVSYNHSYSAGIKNENDPDYFPISNIDNLKEGSINNTIISDFSFEVGASNYRGEYESYDFNALYATFTGLENYGKDIKNHIAVKMLHASSILNTITTQIVSPKISKPVVRIFKNGKITTFSEKYTAILLSEKPFKLGIFDEYNNDYKGKFDFNSKNISSFHLITPIQETEGVFVENLEGSGSITTNKNNTSIDVLLDNIKIVTIFTDGIEIFDNNFNIKIDEEKSDEGVVFVLQNKENLTLARVTYRGGEWIKENRFPDIMQATAQDGYFIKEDDSQKIDLFPELQTDFSKNEFGVGFKDREKYVLKFASGESIGESTKASSDIFLINFGDPSLRLSSALKNSTGFDKTVGKEIYTEKDGIIKKVFKIDFDGDGHKDIASLDTSGYVKFFTNTGTGNFRLWGKGVAIDPQSKMIESINLDRDGFEDIVYADRNGELHYLQNKETIFSITDLPGYFENKTLISGGIEDIDKDGYDDFTYISSNGELSILYGKEKGFEKSKVIDKYHFILPEDSSKDILISFPYIDKIIELKEYLHPISYFTQKSSKSTTLSKVPPNYQDKYQTDNSVDETEISNLLENDEITEEKVLLKELFAPITLFNKSIQVTKQMIADDSNEETLGKKILTKIIITSKDQKSINFTIADPYSSLVSIEETSIQCKNCGKEIVIPIFPSSGRVIVFNDLYLSPNETLTISYSAKINALPKMEMHLGDLNEDNIVDIIVEKKGKGILHYKSSSTREYERVIPK